MWKREGLRREEEKEGRKGRREGEREGERLGEGNVRGKKEEIME